MARKSGSKRKELDAVHVATPCGEPWERMRGDERVRFCDRRQLHVYNLSSMDVEEAGDLIARNEDRLCVRFYRRADGTVLTRDCPIGLETASVRRRRALAALGGLVLITPLLMPTQGAVARPAARRASLQSAARNGNCDIIRAMLDAGVEADCPSQSGVTTLMLAAREGHADAVRLLLSRGANIAAECANGTTALSRAQDGCHVKVVRILKKAGARR